MKDYLQDIVQHTYGLGTIDLVKINGDASGTVINALAEDRSVIVEAKFKNPVPEFLGVFGMPNLGKLNTILNIPEYKENAKLSINTQQNPVYSVCVTWPVPTVKKQRLLPKLKTVLLSFTLVMHQVMQVTLCLMVPSLVT